MENQKRTEKEKVVYFACCPTGSFGAYFWGIVLVLIGGLWLLGNLNIIPAGWGSAIWPFVLIGLGLTCLISTGSLNRE